MGPNPHEQRAAHSLARDRARDLDRPHGQEIQRGGRRVALIVLALLALGLIVWMAFVWLGVIALPGPPVPPA